MQMSDAEHRAMYRYIYSIRAKGNPAPDHAPPATQAKTLTSNLCSKLAGKRNREIALSAKNPTMQLACVLGSTKLRQLIGLTKNVVFKT